MHVVSSATMSSPRQASAQAVQAWAHSRHASMQATSFPRSIPPRSTGWVSSICAAPVRALLPRQRPRGGVAGGSRPAPPHPPVANPVPVRSAVLAVRALGPEEGALPAVLALLLVDE